MHIFHSVKKKCKENGVSSIFGPIITLFNYFNESKIELTPFSPDPIFSSRNKKRPLVDKSKLLENFGFFKQNYLFSSTHSSVIPPASLEYRTPAIVLQQGVTLQYEILSLLIIFFSFSFSLLSFSFLLSFSLPSFSSFFFW